MASTDQASGPPYLVESEPSYPNSTLAYQSISMHPSCQNTSLEELRLQEYNARHTNTNPTPTTVPGSFASASYPVAGPIHCRKAVRASRDDARRLDGEVVVFLVGTKVPKRFTVHEDIVKASSEFVRLALRGEWTEASTRRIPLPDDEPDVFSVYLHWLYSGLIHTLRQSTGLSSESDGEYELLVKAYILGEKILDVAFKNSVIDAIVEKVNEFGFNKRLTSLVFDNTTPASPLRRLWLDVYYHKGKVEWLDPALTGDTISHEFMVEFSRYQMQQRTVFASSDKLDFSLGCTYHEH